jgi:glycosyltransferase 2 family protein
LQERSSKVKRKSVESVLKILLSVGLLVIVLRNVGWQEVWQTLRSAQLPYLMLAFALTVLGIVVRAYRWKVLLDALDIRIPMTRLTSLYFVGTFFSDFLPTGVGGDVVRAYEVAQQTTNRAGAVGTVLVDRATGLLTLFAMASAALLFGYHLVGLQVAAAVLLLAAAGWGGSILLMRRDWLQRLGLLRWLEKIKKVQEVYESVQACGARAITAALAMSLVLNVLLIATNYLIAQALGVHLSIWYFLLYVPIISFLLMLPVSLSGWGVREGGYVYLFGQAGVAAPTALAMSLLVQSFQLGIGLVGAVIYIGQGMSGFRRGLRDRAE